MTGRGSAHPTMHKGTRMTMLSAAITKRAVLAGLSTAVLTMTQAMPVCSADGAAASRGVAKHGAADYATYCAPCHGARGDGRGPMAALLDPKPARHSDAAYMRALSNEYMFRLIREGGRAAGKSPMMAAWRGVLSKQQTWDLIAYIRSLAE